VAQDELADAFGLRAGDGGVERSEFECGWCAGECATLTGIKRDWVDRGPVLSRSSVWAAAEATASTTDCAFARARAAMVSSGLTMPVELSPWVQAVAIAGFLGEGVFGFEVFGRHAIQATGGIMVVS